MRYQQLDFLSNTPISGSTQPAAAAASSPPPLFPPRPGPGRPRLIPDQLPDGPILERAAEALEKIDCLLQEAEEISYHDLETARGHLAATLRSLYNLLDNDELSTLF